MKKTTKRKTSKTAYNREKTSLWEVVIPEPFILDDSIKDEELVVSMAAFESEEELNDFVIDSLQVPTRTMVVSSSEKDLFDYFNKDYGELKYSTVENDHQTLIVVKDKKDNFLGRGEIIRLGKKMMVDKMKDNFTCEMSDFIKRYNSGNTRLANLTVKAEIIKSKIKANMYSATS